MSKSCGITAHGVEYLSRMPHCQLAEGTPDVRGWEVTSPTSVHIGVVRDLLVDLASLRVRYLDVVLDGELPAARRVLLPIEKIWINDALDEVITCVPSLEALPEYDPAHFDREFEHAVLTAFGDEAVTILSANSDDARAQTPRRQNAGCGRRDADAHGLGCPVEAPVTQDVEAANGIQLRVIPEAAD